MRVRGFAGTHLAVELAKGCLVLEIGGAVDVYEAIAI